MHEAISSARLIARKIANALAETPEKKNEEDSFESIVQSASYDAMREMRGFGCANIPLCGSFARGLPLFNISAKSIIDIS